MSIEFSLVPSELNPSSSLARPENDLKDLVKTYRIPLDLHPHLPDPGFTMDHLPSDAIGDWFSFSKRHNTEDVCMEDGPSSLNKWKDKFFLIDRRAIPDYLTWRYSCSCVSNDLPTNGYDRSDVERLCACLICLREMRDEVLVRSGLSSVWFNKEYDLGDAKVAEESYHLSSPLLEHVSSHTTAPAAEGSMIPLPTPDEIVASLPDPCFVKKLKVPSQVRVHSASDTAPEPSQPSKKRKMKKRALETGSSAPKLGQAVGIDEADLTDFCTEIKTSLKRDEGTSTRAALVPTPRLGKRLGDPPSMAVVSASGPSHVRTSVHASTSGHSFSLGVACGLLSAAVSSHAGKSGAEVVQRQIDPLDSLARSALAHDVEYDQILKDNFGIATRGEEIDLTLFPLTPSPYQMSYPYEGASSPLYTKEEWNGPHAPEDNILCKDIFKDPDAGYVKVFRSEVANLDGKLERMQKDYDALGQENRELRSQKDVASDKVKELQTKLTDAKVASIGYKDDVDGLREEVTWFIGSGMESLVRKLLSSDEFHAVLAHVASLGINYSVERGLRMGRTDTEFEVDAQKFSNFHIGAKADFDKALVDFPTTPFPFLGKIVMAARGTLPEVTQVLPDKHIRSVTSVPVALPIANEDANQVPLEHAYDDSAASI
ncbi:hypothetical protein Tco_1244838 [Tanacetum coccineum]